MKATLNSWCWVLGIGFGAACSAAGGSDARGPGAGGDGSGTGAGSGIFNSGSGGDVFGGGLGGNGTGQIGADAACNAVQQKAEKSSGKADIIWIIDNSGSMTEEAAAVQTNMNFFSGFIASKGIDSHVVMISADPSPATNILGIINLVNGICVDAPLGAAGACAAKTDDTNLPTFMHWHVMVNSNDQFSVIESSFQGWRGMLRPDAPKTFVVVTDDNAYDPPKGPSPQEFTTWVNTQPEFQGAQWRFSGVFCSTTQPITSNCANPGANYDVLVDQTGGVKASMGNPDWTAIFTELAGAVVKDAKPVDCEWAIPPPPAGQTLNPNQVNVRFSPSSGPPQTIYGVNAASDCTDQTGGWYYDDPAHPAKVRACPSSCTTMQADLGASVEVLFGCARQLVPR